MDESHSITENKKYILEKHPQRGEKQWQKPNAEKKWWAELQVLRQKIKSLREDRIDSCFSDTLLPSSCSHSWGNILVDSFKLAVCACAGIGQPFLWSAREWIISVWGNTGSVATTQLCHCSLKAATDNISTNECGCVPTQLYWQKQTVDGIWLSLGHSFIRLCLGLALC